MTNCEENEHVVDWKIEKFSCCPQLTGDRLSTGRFISKNLSNTAWKIHLCPRGDEDGNDISCFLTRVDDNDEGPKKIYVTFEFSLLTSEGLQTDKKVLSENRCFFRGISWGIKHFVKRDDIFRDKETYLLKDMLTLRCRLRKCVPQITKNFINIRTIFGTLSSTIRLPIKIFYKETRKSSTFFPIGTESVKDLLTFTVSVKKDTVLEYLKIRKEAESTFGSQVHIDITKKKSPFPVRVSCRVKVVDKAEKFPLEHTAEYMFEEKSQKETWNFPRFIKINELTKSMIEDNTITLEFHIRVYNPCFETTYIEKDLTPTTVTLTEKNWSLNNDLFALYETGLFSDAKLKIGDEYFPVHRSILSIRSSVFRKLFEEYANSESATDDTNLQNGIKECVLEITDIDRKTLTRTLNFIYADIFNVEDFTSGLSLYACAYKYGISSLKVECYNFLKTHMPVRQTFKALLLAHELNDGDLKLLALDVITNHHEYALLTEEWVEFAEKEQALMSHVLRHIRINKRKW